MENVFELFDIKNYPLQQATLDGARIGYRIAGQGKPLLFITGYGATMDMWAPQLLRDIIAAGHQVIVFDNRGIAHSSADGTDFSIKLFADDAAALLKHLGIAKAGVIGWSMGSYIAQELALNHPQLVSKLVLYSSAPGGAETVQPDDETAKALGDTSGTLQEREMRAFMSLFPADWLQNNRNPLTFFPIPEIAASPEIMARQLTALLGWEGSINRLPQLAAGTLLLTGSADIILPPRNSAILAENISGSWLIQMKNGGHGMMYQYPQQIAAAINCFLNNDIPA